MAFLLAPKGMGPDTNFLSLLDQNVEVPARKNPVCCNSARSEIEAPVNRQGRQLAQGNAAQEMASATLPLHASHGIYTAAIWARKMVLVPLEDALGLCTAYLPPLALP